jgi:Protein of unknown function (DUF3443)
VLGVGVFAQDCGPACVGVANENNGIYFACTSAACQPTAVASLASQVTNPVVMFASDNNGVIIQLPSVPAQGAATLSGYMIFGIDTQTNNASGSQPVLTVDSNFGDLTTVYKGASLHSSFVDTGSNGLYFNDSSLTACSESGFSGFYCPASTQNLTATLQGQNSRSAGVNFSVASADTLGAGDPTLVAFSTLAGTITISDAFDWGLPFYYGRTVYTAVENGATAVGNGPYVAF